MKKFIPSLLPAIALALLPVPSTSQECVNCWINPQTGKLESLDFSNPTNPQISQPAGKKTGSASANQSSQGRVIVFGRRTCGLTTAMMRQLATNKISYQFKNVDDRTVNLEMWNLLRTAGLASQKSIRLPVLSVQGKTLVNASISDVKALLR